MQKIPHMAGVSRYVFLSVFILVKFGVGRGLSIGFTALKYQSKLVLVRGSYGKYDFLL